MKILNEKRSWIGSDMLLSHQSMKHKILYPDIWALTFVQVVALLHNGRGKNDSQSPVRWYFVPSLSLCC